MSTGRRPLRRTGRVYERGFDYSGARRMRGKGVPVREIAAHYGVSVSRVYQVTATDPEAVHQRQLEAHREWRTTTCESCGGPAMRLTSGKRPWDGRTLCVACRGRAKRTRFRFDERTGELVAVRCLAVDCANGGERWQPPDNFPGDINFRDLRPKGFHTHCRACNTRYRQQYRERHKIPCVACGKPRLPANEKARRGSQDTGLCLDCYRASVTR